MQEIVLDETLDDMDRDGDGYVTVKEYIGEYDIMIMDISNM